MTALRFSDLKSNGYNITGRMFTLQLKELELDGTIKRTAYSQ
jgi:DNA-binding HxlR family transcriptional regulator